MSITISELENMIRNLTEARQNCERIDKLKKEVDAIYDEQDRKLQATLKELGKTSYKVEGLGTYSVVSRLVVTTPKTTDEKRAFMEYVKNKYGDEVMVDKLTINYQTLNSFYNAEFEAAKQEDKAKFELPGISAPVEQVYSKWRSDTPKGGAK